MPPKYHKDVRVRTAEELAILVMDVRWRKPGARWRYGRLLSETDTHVEIADQRTGGMRFIDPTIAEVQVHTTGPRGGKSWQSPPEPGERNQ